MSIRIGPWNYIVPLRRGDRGEYEIEVEIYGDDPIKVIGKRDSYPLIEAALEKQINRDEFDWYENKNAR